MSQQHDALAALGRCDRRTAGHRLWSLAAGVSAALLIGAPAAAGAAGDWSEEPAGPAEQPEITPLEFEMLALINGARAEAGTHLLRWDRLMTAESRSHAQEMLRRNIVSHTGADGSSPRDRLQRMGVNCRWCSENIWMVWTPVASDGPFKMFSAMMDEPLSPDIWNHRRNIVYEGYARVGVGFAVDGHIQVVSVTFAEAAPE